MNSKLRIMLALAGGAFPLAANGTCPTLVAGDAFLAKNSTYTVQINSGGLSNGEEQAGWDALGAMNYENSNSSNPNWNQTNTNLSSVSSGASIQVNFDTTTTNPTNSEGQGIDARYNDQHYTSGPNKGVIETATITIYLASQACGGPCFDSSQPNYARTIQADIEHEITHLMGVKTDFKTAPPPGTDPTIMGPDLGVNDQGGGKSLDPSPCDNNFLKKTSKTRCNCHHS